MDWKAPLKAVAKTLLPKSYAKRRLSDRQSGFSEAEMRLLPALADTRKLSLDIGAAKGEYCSHLVLHSSGVVAFEPLGFDGSEIAWITHALNLPIRFEKVALSDQQGEAPMRILEGVKGLGTIEPANTLKYSGDTSIIEFAVDTRTLDSYGLSNVGLIKVDVEGHENSVLRGAWDTLQRNRCSLLVECEERHSPGAIEKLFSFTESLEYAGYFLLGENIIPISDFRTKEHQDPSNLADWRGGWKRSGLYINNFIFIPREKTTQFMLSCEKLAISLPQKPDEARTE